MRGSVPTYDTVVVICGGPYELILEAAEACSVVATTRQERRFSRKGFFVEVGISAGTEAASVLPSMVLLLVQRGGGGR
jgi:hypothetical protein